MALLSGERIKPPEDMVEFLSKFDGKHIFVGISQGGVTTPRAGTIHELYEELQTWNSMSWDIYFTVNEPFATRRRIEDMVRARAVFIDDDTPREGGPRTEFELEPSLIVESSRGKYHYYWLTDTDNILEWNKVQQTLITKYNTDPAIKDISRVLRLPGTKHRNGDDCKWLGGTGLTHSWGKIKDFFPPKESSINEDVTSGDSEDNKSMVIWMNSFMSGKSIAPSMNSLIMHMAYRYSVDKIKHEVTSMFNQVESDVYEAHAERYEGARSQIDKFIKSAKKKVESKSISQMPDDKPMSTVDRLELDWAQLKSNPMPMGMLPQTLVQAAKEIGSWAATGPDPAIISGIQITSALLNKSIVIHEIGDDLTTHCQCGCVVVMDTGARKSAIYEQMNKPYFDYEDKLIEEWDKVKNTNIALAELYTKQRQTLGKKKETKEQSDSEILHQATQMGNLDDKIAKIQVKRPCLRSSDITEEKLVRKLDENNGSMAVISDDARQVINNMRGRYSDNNTGESVYINALTGSDITYERVGSDKDILIKKPVLNALLFVQPDAALQLKNSEMYVPSGLAARLPIFFYPISGAQIVRDTERRLVNKERMEPYYKALRSLCHNRQDNPLHIRLDDRGMDVCRAMDQELADKLGNEWVGHYDKTNKIITLTLMYSTCMAALEDPEFKLSFMDNETSSYTLPIKYLNMGFEYAKALFSQSIQSHSAISDEAIPRKATTFADLLLKWYKTGKIYEGFVECGALKSSLSPSYRDQVGELLELLVEKGWVYITSMTDSRRKLNGGFPDKFVEQGDKIYHLNVEGIKAIKKGQVK